MQESNPEKSYPHTAEEVFDEWALDYHAAGMEEEHWPSVKDAFELIEPSDGLYLEVGVGNGYGLFYMATNQYAGGQCLGLDVSANMVALAQKRVTGLDNVTVRHADFLDFEPHGPAPDMIFSMEVFYYFPNNRDGVARAFDLLNPGGKLMILVNHYEERADSHGWPDQLETPMQLWSAKDYFSSMIDVGFVGCRSACLRRNGQAQTGTLGTWGSKPIRNGFG